MTDKSLEFPLPRPRFSQRIRVYPLERLISQPALQNWIGVLVLSLVLLAAKLPLLLQYAASSGADPGNWLSLAWSLTGQGTRLSPWAYPPLTFILLRILLVVFNPLVALKILGLGIWIGMTSAVWLVLRRSLTRLPAIISLGIAAFFGLSTYNNEIFAWGGFPQMLGLAFLILAIPSLERWLVNGDPRQAWAAVLTGAGVIYTHHLITALLPWMALLVFGWVIYHERWQRSAVVRRGAWWAIVLAVLSLPAGLIYWNYLHLLAGNPANANGYSLKNLTDMASYVFRDLEPLWLLFIALSLAAPFLVRRSPISGTVLAFTLGPIGAFALLFEVRLLQVLFAGIAFSLALLFNRAWSQPAEYWIRKARLGALVIGLALTLMFTAMQGQHVFLETSAYYRVIENDMLPSLSWMKSHTAPGERVAVSNTKPDLLGWWVEGLSQRPALYAANLRWLSFAQERQYTAAANQIFDIQSTPTQITDLITKFQIHYLFIDMKYSENNLQRLVGMGILAPVYQDGRITILKVK